MRRAQRRGALHQRRDDLPAEPPVVERVGRDRDLEALTGIERQPEQMPGQHVGGAGLARVAVEPRERLADVLVGDHLAGRVEPGAAAVDRGGALRVPGQRLRGACTARAPAGRDASTARRRRRWRRPGRCGRRSRCRTSRSRAPFRAAGRAARRRNRRSHTASASRSRSSPRRRAHRRPRRPGPCWRATASGTRTRLR